jgi:transcriptional regulator with XRE-family HTH domain
VERNWKAAGAQVAALRQAKGLSQLTLSEIAGLHPRTVQRAEAGKCCYETLAALAAAMDADVDEFLRPPRPAPQVLAADAGAPDQADTSVILSKLTTGKALLDLLDQSVAVRLDHDHVVGEDVELVGAFLQAIHGWSALIHELTPVERVRAAAHLHDQLAALEKRNLRVVGGVQSRPINVDLRHNVMRPVAVVAVRARAESKPGRRGRR